MAIENVEQATRLAIEFARRYYPSVFPVSTRKQNLFWVVDLDISFYRMDFVRLRIDRETGIIEDFKVTPSQLL